jgi:hypothetical protein
MSSTMVVSEVDGVVHRASPRNEARLLIEIETDRAGTWSLMETAIECPYPLNGERQVHKQQLVIYEHQLPGVRALVRTDAHAAVFADAMAMAPQTVPPGEQISLGEKRRKAEETLGRSKKSAERSIAASNLEEADRQIAREAIRLLCMRPGMRDGLPPLLSARVIKNAAAPPSPQNLAANANSDLAAVLRQLLEERDTKRKG